MTEKYEDIICLCWNELRSFPLLQLSMVMMMLSRKLGA